MTDNLREWLREWKLDLSNQSTTLKDLTWRVGKLYFIILPDCVFRAFFTTVLSHLSAFIPGHSWRATLLKARTEPLESGCLGSKPGCATYSVMAYLPYAFLSSPGNEGHHVPMLSGCSENKSLALNLTPTSIRWTFKEKQMGACNDGIVSGRVYRIKATVSGLQGLKMWWERQTRKQ